MVALLRGDDDDDSAALAAAVAPISYDGDGTGADEGRREGALTDVETAADALMAL